MKEADQPKFPSMFNPSHQTRSRIDQLVLLLPSRW